MAASRKILLISTKYFMCINWGHNAIYLQNMKFVRLILWPGGAYTDGTYAIKPESRSHIMPKKRVPVNSGMRGKFVWNVSWKAVEGIWPWNIIAMY